MNQSQFKAVLGELVEENPLAVRAVLKILDIEFTDQVDTLAVTVEAQPRLLVNLKFLKEHCRSETDVKAVICHEFLHVLLRHTDGIKLDTPADHLALDAVINAIIHRTLGTEYSDMMGHYYASVGYPYKLLRPYTYREQYRDFKKNRPLMEVWVALYDGRLCADDIRELANDLDLAKRGPRGGYLGGHDNKSDEEALSPVAPPSNSPALADALERSLRAMNGDGIWRGPKPGVGATEYQNQVVASDAGVNKWQRATYKVLKRHLLPDPNSPREPVGEAVSRLPVLNPSDRRGFARALWSPLLPDIAWTNVKHAPAGRTQVYLDVSGSMNAEMPLIVALLARLSRHIKRPFWAFSNRVAPAVIRDGQLRADTTGGTSMSCVLEHLARTKPRAAVVVTDGYIERLDRKLLADCRETRLHAIVTRDGSAGELHRAGIPYTQLGRLPK